MPTSNQFVAPLISKEMSCESWRSRSLHSSSRRECPLGGRGGLYCSAYGTYLALTGEEPEINIAEKAVILQDRSGIYMESRFELLEEDES